MQSLLIMTHGNFGKALLESAELIVGEQKNVGTMSVFLADDVEKLKEEMLEKVNLLDTSAGLIVLTDIVGGTPTNLASSLLTSEEVVLVSGVNLPVLLEILMNREAEQSSVIQSIPAAYEQGLVIRTHKDLMKEEEDNDLL